MKHLIKFIELIFAIILSALLFPLGLLFNIVVGFKKLHLFLWMFLVEVYELVFDSFEKVAVIIDRLGNVIDGNLFIRAFIFKEHRKRTLFNQSEVTISAAFGHAQKHGYLNKRGCIFVRMLDDIFGKDHCLLAHEFDLLKQTFNHKTGIS